MTHEPTTDIVQQAEAALARFCATGGVPMEFLVEDDGEGAAAVRYTGPYAAEAPMRL